MQNGHLRLDKQVGERGANLSGGQRQRLRSREALVSMPKLLILDEFTSSMDPKTEAKMLELIRDLSSDIIVLIVSHQISPLSYADDVYELSSKVLQPRYN